jgi:hypothetical protein
VFECSVKCNFCLVIKLLSTVSAYGTGTRSGEDSAIIE